MIYNVLIYTSIKLVLIFSIYFTILLLLKYNTVDILDTQNKNAEIIKLIKVIENPNTLKLTVSHGGLLLVISNLLLYKSLRVGKIVLQLLGANHQWFSTPKW